MSLGTVVQKSVDTGTPPPLLLHGSDWSIPKYTIISNLPLNLLPYSSDFMRFQNPRLNYRHAPTFPVGLLMSSALLSRRGIGMQARSSCNGAVSAISRGQTSWSIVTLLLSNDLLRCNRVERRDCRLISARVES